MKLFRKQIKVKVYAIVYDDYKGEREVALQTGYSLEEAIDKLPSNKGKQVRIVGTDEKDLEEMANEYLEEVVALKKLKS